MIKQLSVLLLLLGHTAAAEPDYVTLGPEKRSELMAGYPNPAWGRKNWMTETLVKLEDYLFTWANRFNTRTYFLITDEGVVLGDPISTKDAPLIRKAIASVTDKPVTHVIYSHNHWDHVKGAKIFKDEGATIIAHQKCRQRMFERPHPDAVVPDVGFSGNHRLEIGGERIDLLYFGDNHSSCLIFPVLKGGKYLVMVDVVSPGAIPWGPIPDTDFIGSIETLAQLEKLDFEMAIPGHGVPIAPKSSIVERRLYLTALMKAVEEELAPNGFQPEFYDNVTKKMEPWAHMRAFSFQFRENLNTMLYYVGIGE